MEGEISRQIFKGNAGGRMGAWGAPGAKGGGSRAAARGRAGDEVGGGVGQGSLLGQLWPLPTEC